MSNHVFSAGTEYTGPEYAGARIRVTARTDGGYFSVTADIKKGRRELAGGCIHREVLQYWPALAPLVALHLSDSETGAPMHAEANAWYWLAGYYGGAGERHHGGNGDRQHWLADGTFNGYRHSTPDECLATFADHVRITVESARILADAWRASHSFTLTGPAVMRACLREWIRTNASNRWAREASDGRALLASLCAGAES